MKNAWFYIKKISHDIRTQILENKEITSTFLGFVSSTSTLSKKK